LEAPYPEPTLTEKAIPDKEHRETQSRDPKTGVRLPK
jgi:hypothetical protein